MSNGSTSSEEAKQSPPETSLLEALNQAYEKINAACATNREEQQIRIAALWAVESLQRSANAAKTPGLKSAIYWMELGFKDIGNAVFPTQ